MPVKILPKHYSRQTVKHILDFFDENGYALVKF